MDEEVDHVRGPRDAPVTLVEYGDFECPFCARVSGVGNELRAHFGDRLRYVTRHLPLPVVTATVFATWFGAEAVFGVSSTFVKEGLRGVVADNGPGVPPDVLQRLTREPVTTRADAGGSGMGPGGVRDLDPVRHKVHVEDVPDPARARLQPAQLRCDEPGEARQRLRAAPVLDGQAVDACRSAPEALRRPSESRRRTPHSPLRAPRWPRPSPRVAAGPSRHACARPPSPAAPGWPMAPCSAAWTRATRWIVMLSMTASSPH